MQAEPEMALVAGHPSHSFSVRRQSCSTSPAARAAVQRSARGVSAHSGQSVAGGEGLAVLRSHRGEGRSRTSTRVSSNAYSAR